MPVIAINDLAAALEGGKTLAGLDLGEKTIGVAVSDRGLSFAHPRPVILRKKFSIDAAALLDLLTRENVGAVAMGLPVNMDGSEGPRAQASRAFVRNIAKLTGTYVKEVSWYRELAAGSGVAAPRCHHAEIADDDVDFVLILSDLTPARQGDCHS